MKTTKNCYYSIATRIPPSQTKMTGWLEDCRTGGLEGWGVLKGQTWFTNFGFEAKLNFLYWVRFLEDMRASRGSAAFRSLCGDCGTFDARIGEGMGWNGIGWHVQSMFINDDQCWTMLISVGQRWSMLVNVDGVDQCSWVVTSVDQCWSMLINVDHWRSISISVVQCWCWWMLIKVDQCESMVNDAGQCWSVLINPGQYCSMLPRTGQWL